MRLRESLRAAHERAELARRGVRVLSHERDPQLREIDDLVHRLTREARAKAVTPIRGAKIYKPSFGGSAGSQGDQRGLPPSQAVGAGPRTSGSVCESGSGGVLVPLFPASGGASTTPSGDAA